MDRIRARGNREISLGFQGPSLLLPSRPRARVWHFCHSKRQKPAVANQEPEHLAGAALLNALVDELPDIVVGRAADAMEPGGATSCPNEGNTDQEEEEACKAGYESTPEIEQARSSERIVADLKPSRELAANVRPEGYAGEGGDLCSSSKHRRVALRTRDSFHPSSMHPSPSPSSPAGAVCARPLLARNITQDHRTNLKLLKNI